MQVSGAGGSRVRYSKTGVEAELEELINVGVTMDNRALVPVQCTSEPEDLEEMANILAARARSAQDLLQGEVVDLTGSPAKQARTDNQ